MTTPTVFSNAAYSPQIAKGEPQQVTAEKATVTVPASTASGTVIGMIRFQPGFSLTGFALASDDLDSSTNVTLDVGYVYDNTTGEDDNAFLSASTIAQAGGSYVWPVASGLLVGKSFTATDSGYIVVKTGGGATTTEGDLNMIAQWTYNLGY